MFPGLDMYYVDPGQHLTTAGEKLDDLDRDLSDLSVRGVQNCKTWGVSVGCCRSAPSQLEGSRSTAGSRR